MPKFTVESTYLVPYFRHTTYNAASPEAAAALALADEEWGKARAAWDDSTPHKVTGIWKGEDAAYTGEAVPVLDLDEVMRAAAMDMYSALKLAIDTWPSFDDDDNVNGADLVDWFASWRETAKAAAFKAEGQNVATIYHEPLTCVAAWKAVYPINGVMASSRYPSEDEARAALTKAGYAVVRGN